MSDAMTSTKPYIVRAFYDWISDNHLTPYIVVDVSVYGVLVPMNYVNDGQIILNISSSAVGAISMAGEQIEFSARFGGKLETLVVPYGAVAAIYAKENGAGTQLPIEHPEQNDEPKAGVSELKSVDGTTGSKASETRNTAHEGENEAATSATKPPTKAKPSLKVIK